jgi:transcriptional regulator with XRE-family HTH domain
MSDQLNPTAEGLEQLASIVKQARGRHSYRGFEEVCDVSHATIRRLEKVEVAGPEVQTLAKLAPYTPYSASELVDIVSGRDPQAVRSILVFTDVLPAAQQLPPIEKFKLIHSLLEDLHGPIDPQNRLQFQGWIHKEREMLSEVTGINPDRLREIIQGSTPGNSELVSLSQALGLLPEVTVRLYDSLSPARVKQALKIAAESKQTRYAPPLGGKGKVTPSDQLRAPTADRRYESAEPPESG